MSSQEPILPQIGFASDLDVEERAQFGNFGELVSLNEGDILIDERHEQDALFLVIMGTLHVQTDVTGRSILLGTVKAGDTIGEVSIFDPGNASASVVARSITEVWKIDRERLEQYLEAHPRTAVQVLIRIATQLSKRLRTTNEKVAMAREAMLDSF
jgi:CRP-like cAMP-binding protein